MAVLDFFSELINKFNIYFTDYITVFLLLAAGVYFSFKTKFVQIRCFKDGLRIMLNGIFKSRKSNVGISSFAALTTAVGAQVGTGNIIGAAAAIIIGGPGAVFWMWVSAFFGMATVYIEAVAAQLTREKTSDGSYIGGPVFYIRKAFRGRFGRFAAAVFSLSAVLALGFSGAMVQSNAVSNTFFESYNIPHFATGVLLAAVSALALSGGIKRITKISEKLVVLMAFLFLAVCGYILIIRINELPTVLNLIVKGALKPSSVLGGGFGAALKKTVSEGVKKGIFSNEAGMGTTPHIHAVADAETPHKQGVCAMMGVFVDTFVILNVTAFVMIMTLYNPDGSFKYIDLPDMNNMMLLALSKEYPSGVARLIMSISILLFGFSSIIGWNYFGRVNAEYLWGEKGSRIYIVFSIIFIFAGSVFNSGFVWSLTDVFNTFLIIPNISALYFLVKIRFFDKKQVKMHKS